MKKPNILIFMTDQQRGDSVLPNSKVKTPNVDKFAAEGVLFSECYTVSPHCCPSRASFFSGLYPTQHGVWNNVDVGNTLSKGLYKDVRLWSEELKEAGYSTFFNGKWHVSSLESPLDRGFDYAKTWCPAKREYVHEKPHMLDWNSYDNFSEPTQRKDGQILRQGYETYTMYGEKENPFGDDDVVNSALEIIRSKKTAPWCHFVGTLGPHDPYFVPQKYLDMYDISEIELPDNFSDRLTDKPNLYRRMRDRFDQLTEREQREAIRHYLAFCTYEDALFGKLLDALDESGEADNTLVLYISDHGDYAAEHGLWCKGLPCFKGAYHIPSIIRWKDGIKNRGRVCDEFVNLTDFAPTFLEVAGVETNLKFCGKSLMPFLCDEKPHNWRKEIFTQSNGNELYGIQRSIMTREYKYVYNGFDYDEFYDLKKDSGETKNLINDKNYAEIIRNLSKAMWQFAYSAGDTCVNQYITVSLATYGPGVIK